MHNSGLLVAATEISLGYSVAAYKKQLMLAYPSSRYHYLSYICPSLRQGLALKNWAVMKFPMRFAGIAPKPAENPN